MRTELCAKARQLGSVGEAVAAESQLCQRQTQASFTLTEAAASGSATAYATAVATAEAVAVKAEVMTAAAASLASRRAQAADTLSNAADISTWSEFDSARNQAVFLGNVISEAEATMQQRRDAASTALSDAVTFCIDDSLINANAAVKETSHRAQQDGQVESGLDTLCTICCGADFGGSQLLASNRIAPGTSCHRITEGKAAGGLFLPASNDQGPSVQFNQRALSAITNALHAVRDEASNTGESTAIARRSC